MEIMRLIFGSFWVYCGVVIMIYVAALCLSMIVGTVISTIRGDSVKINIGRGNVFRVTPIIGMEIRTAQALVVMLMRL